ncbi:LysM peptidoglycan-binding domain-containing protein [Methylobacterium sp. 17Sr1-1]|uniref:LysM peptidoglycan-binding domain-containing protein n=1 Tax=Methylobacterium sp. 17Sr1-1 TaxID=2202826 RepID=UPI000D700C80|nr:LysM peptidoglycan-binding domain-containing protein [Methylobacterium sp. 17Sr1-1]AWN53742.1 peptidoglycan-binding protein [Methylobacterium sp. 17Sr1-1]
MTTELRASELRRGIVLAAVGLVAGFVLIGVAASGTRLFSLDTPEETGPHPGTTAPAPAVTPLAALPAKPDLPAAAGDAPSFDVLRVEPDGASVLAGRSRPGAEIEVLRDGQPFARTRADEAGNFALVPPSLPPGSHEITLRSTAADGATASSRASAVVVVAEDRRTKPLVAVTVPGQPTAVLSLPEPAKVETAKVETAKAETRPPAGPQPVKVVGVDAEPGGRLYVTAQGAPRADLRLYLNDTLVAPGQAGPDGRVAFTIGRGVKPGDYRVRIDQVDPATGSVKTRAETAFAVPPNLGPAVTGAAEVPARQPLMRGAAASGPVVAVAPSAAVPPAGATATALAPAGAPGAEAAQSPAEAGTVFVPGISTAKVIRGDNLWSISRRAYGKGLRYTVIFDANQRQIRDPNRIYPGQVFVLPGEGPQAREPESRG